MENNVEQITGKKRFHSKLHARVATPRQVLALENILKGKGKDIGKALLAAGYSRSVANSPQIVTDSKGYKQILHRAGLTPELIATSLTEDIIGKPKRRVQELRLAADVLGMTSEKAKENDFAPISINIKQLQVNNIAPDALQSSESDLNEKHDINHALT